MSRIGRAALLRLRVLAGVEADPTFRGYGLGKQKLIGRIDDGGYLLTLFILTATNILNCLGEVFVGRQDWILTWESLLVGRKRSALPLAG
ncbi:MAG: hypothetical protein M3Z32_10970 [Acidobacteriota bacterium]|nr:hypothetical protein [Acidobacteriota bacterium]